MDLLVDSRWSYRGIYKENVADFVVDSTVQNPQFISVFFTGKSQPSFICIFEKQITKIVPIDTTK